MLDKFVKTARDRIHQIESNDEDIIAWFNNDEVTQTDKILNQLNNERFYQPIFDTLTDAIILDVGANVGLFTLYAMDNAKQIISMEPTPKTFNVLTRLTAGFNNIKPVQVALGGTDGTVDFYINDNPTINSLVNQVGTAVTVQTRTIETVLKEHNLDWVDFVKCDIEGSEIQAITDATLAPVADKIGFWALEVHQTDAHTGAFWPGNLDHNRHSLAAVFQRHGYQVEFAGHDQLFAWRA